MYDLLNTGLVFTDSKNEKAEPFTTNLVIADYAGIKVRSVNKTISSHEKELREFGLVRFKIARDEKIRNSKPIKMYLLNNEQTLFLFTLLRNTNAVVDIKLKLVKSFSKAKELLKSRQIIHEKSKPITKTLGQAIKDNTVIDSKHAYSNFNRLIYKTALGMNTNQLKLNRNIPENESISDYLTIDEQKQLNKVKQLVISLLQMDYSYQDIKNVVTNMPQKQLQVS